MAVGHAAVWECRETGDPANAAGFDSTIAGAGTDFSQQDAPQVLIDNATITTSITGATVTFTGGYVPSSADVGNCVRFNGGTNITVGPYFIIGQTPTTWTLDRSPVTSGTTTNATGRMGGGNSDGGLTVGMMALGNWIYCRGNMVVSNTGSNVLGGRMTLPASNNGANATRMIGYAVTRGDGGQAKFTASGISNVALITATAQGPMVENITCDGDSCTLITGFSLGQWNLCFRCIAVNCATAGFSSTQSGALAIACEAHFGGSGFLCSALGCVANAVGGEGFESNSFGSVFLFCVAVNGTGVSSDGFFFHNFSSTAICCNAVNCGRDGFHFNGSVNTYCLCINCAATDNGNGYGFNAEGVSQGGILINCAGFNNSAGDINTGFIPAFNVLNFVHLAGEPWVSRPGLNFATNGLAGAGALMKAAGFFSSFPGLATASFGDVGAAQSAVSVPPPLPSFIPPTSNQRG